MDYFGIVEKAYKITLKNKFLWIFGILAGGAAGFQGYSSFPNYATGGSEWANSMNKFTDNSGAFDFATFWSNYGGLVIALVAIFMVIAIVLFVLNIISQGALIASVEKIEKDNKSDFYHGFHEGSKQFWRIWAMNLTYLFMILISLIILIVPVCVLVISGQYVVATILGILLFLICLLFWILIRIIAPYSLQIIVLKKNGIFESIRESLHLVRDNLLDVIVMYLIIMGIGILVGIAIVLVFLLLIGLLLVVGYGIFLASVTAAVVYGCIIGLAILVATVVFTGALNSFYSVVITLTYLKLASK